MIERNQSDLIAIADDGKSGTNIAAVENREGILITDEGAHSLTPTENWPLKRIRIQGAEFVRPDLLVR